MFKKILLLLLCVSLLTCAACLEKPAEVTDGGTSASVSTKEETEESTPEVPKPQEDEQDEYIAPDLEVPVKPEVPAWKTGYLDFLKANKDEYVSFALVYVDNDNIPELYLSGNCEAAGDMVCSYKSGKVVKVHLNRTHGGSYIKKGGLVLNINGNMGYYYANVYKLTASGFTNIFSGSQEERIVDTEDGNFDIEYDFIIGETIVTEEEYYAAIKAVFNYDIEQPLHENEVSYNTIRQQINNF